MQNAGLDEAQARIKTARKNINNFRYVDDTTLMAECEEKLKSLLKVEDVKNQFTKFSAVLHKIHGYMDSL